jgi:hypothetical protein
MRYKIYLLPSTKCHFDGNAREIFYAIFLQISQSPKGMPLAEDSIEMTFTTLTAIAKIYAT